MAMTNFLEAELLDHFLNNNVYTPPTSLYVALFTTATDDTGAGTEVLTAGTAYARIIRTGGFTISGVATRAGNTASIDYVTATLDWGTITHVGLFDALTGGNMLLHGALTAPRLVESGDTFSYAIDALGITLS